MLRFQKCEYDENFFDCSIITFMSFAYLMRSCELIYIQYDLMFYTYRSQDTNPVLLDCKRAEYNLFWVILCGKHIVNDDFQNLRYLLFMSPN